MLKEFITISAELDRAGLVWHPEIGDEVSVRPEFERVSILVDPQGMTPGKLRESYLWLPTVEQLVTQLEAREAFIYHAGITNSFKYEVVVKASSGMIETAAINLRLALGQALEEILLNGPAEILH